MPLPAQYARVALNFTNGKVTWQNILWFTLVGAFPSTFDINAAAASIDTEYENAYRVVMGSDTFYLGTDLRVNNSGVTGTASTILNADGQGVDIALPAEVAAVVRLQTAVPGGSGRGRLFVSGIADENNNGGKIASAGLAAFVTLAGKFKTGLAIQTMSWTPCVYSRKLGNLETIVSTQFDSVFGAQRHRRPKR